MSGRAQVVVVMLSIALMLASIQVLRWAAGEIDDFNFAPNMPPDAGEVLDPDDAAWLGWAPERTAVEPDSLAESLAILSEHLSELTTFVLKSEPSPVSTRVQIPRGWKEVDFVRVLIGARQQSTVQPPPDREVFIEDLVERLTLAGWEISTTIHDAIQTTYPLVTPGPTDLLMEGVSPLGNLSVRAPAEGAYTLTFSVGPEQL